jgi:hypothetical protein
MYDREQMKVALGQLAWNTVVSILQAADQPTPELIHQLVEDVVRTGCLIKKHATAAQRAHRDGFVADLRGYIEGIEDADLLLYLDAHIAESQLIERAYLTILASVAECVISQRTYPEQV